MKPLEPGPNSTWLIGIEDWQIISPGVLFHTFKFFNEERKDHDGAFVEIRPGHHTPVQFNASKETVFTEIPVQGNSFFLHVSRDGVFSMRIFDASNLKVPQKCIVLPGEIMCWFASSQQVKGKIVKITESERPDFQESDLMEVRRNASLWGATAIPLKFWHTLDYLEAGKEREAIALNSNN